MKKMCKKSMNIKDGDVQEIIRYSKTLPLLAELEGCDTFIDCFTNDPNKAIVVAQCSPPNSLYGFSFIGEFIYRHQEPAVFRTFELGVISKEIKAVVDAKAQGREILVRQNVTVLRNTKGEKIGVIIMEKPLFSGNSHKDEIEQQSFKNLNKNQTISPYLITQLVHDSVVCFNKDGIAIFANERAKRIYQNLEYKEDIVNMSFENLAFGDFTFEDIMVMGNAEQKNIKIGKYYLKVIYSKITEGDECIGVVLIIRDITEELSTQKELILKSTAIYEMHHRVKNNLQTIISLIRLQEKRTRSPEVEKVCDEIINRIYSISLTHEILSKRSEDTIGLKEMLSQLAENTKKYVMAETRSLSIFVTGENVETEFDIGGTVAMIVNELLQNSIKHAFLNKENGKIVINILQKNNLCSILFSDNGVGFNPNVVNSDNLGIKLVRSLVNDKLSGLLHINSSKNGTKVQFSFSIKKIINY